MQQRRNQRRAEELLVVEGGVEQRHHAAAHGVEREADGRHGLTAFVAHRHLDAGRKRADGGAHVALNQPRVGAELGVVQQGHLGRAALLDGAREIGRDQDHAVDVGAAQTEGGLGLVVVALRKVQAGRGLQETRELARQAGVVGIHQPDGQARGQPGGKDPPQQGTGEQWHPADKGQVPGPAAQLRGLAAGAVNYCFNSKQFKAHAA